MKNSNRWLLPLCLTWFCVLAASSNVACAQVTQYAYPKYKVMGVVYAPPGSASNVNYTNSTMVGSTDTLSTLNSNTQDVTASVSASFGIPLVFSTTITYNFEDQYTDSSQDSNSVQIQSTQGNSITTMGPISSSLGVDHDNDIIYIWLNPVIEGNTAPLPSNPAVTALNWTGLYSNSCDPNTPGGPPSFYQAISGCDPNQYPYPDIVGIPVWCLKNPYYPSPSCSQWLPYTSRSWDAAYFGANPANGNLTNTDPNTGLPLGPGLTMRDYADILQADPFVVLNGAAINACHPSYGPSLDPNLSETFAQPLNPQAVFAWPVQAGPVGATTPRVNYADPYDPGWNNTPPYTTTNPSPTGYLPITCNTVNNSTSSGYPANTMSRFVPYGTVEYPVPGPNGLPSTYGGKLLYSQTNTSTNMATDTHTVTQGVSISICGGLGCSSGGGMNEAKTASFGGSASFGYSNANTIQHQSTFSAEKNSSWEADYSITGPQLSDNYVGPATYNVYLDSVYNTYAFYSDLSTPPTPSDLGYIGISISPTPTPSTPIVCSPTSPTACLVFPPPPNNPPAPYPQAEIVNIPGQSPYYGTSSAEYQVTLTNDSAYPITMVWPAVTFSDPGFLLVENDGTDNCSNKQIAAFSTANNSPTSTTPDYCTLNIVFSPVYSDAPNTIVGQTQLVTANIIAAGTVNVSATGSYQDVLSTNYAIVQGVAAPNMGMEQGGMLTPSYYTFPQNNVWPLPPEVFTFTNYNTSPVELASAGSDITLSNPTDYQVVSDTCAGATIYPQSDPSQTDKKSCTFTLQYIPTAGALGFFGVNCGGGYCDGVQYEGVSPGLDCPQTSYELALAPCSLSYPIIGTKITMNGYVGTSAALTPLTYAGAVAQIPNNQLTIGQLDTQTGVNRVDAGTYSGMWGYETPLTPFTVTNNTLYSINNLQLTPPPLQVQEIGTCTSSTTLAPGQSCTASVEYLPLGESYNLYKCPFNFYGFYFILGTGKYSSGPYSGTSVPVSPALYTLLFKLTPCNNNSGDVVGIKGTEKSTVQQIPATNAMGSLTIKPASANPVSKQGTVSATVGSFKATASYAAGATGSTVAQALAKALNVKGSPVKATASGDVVTLTSATAGTAGNLSIAATGDAKFAIAVSGKALAGGQNASTKTVNDAGTVKLTTNGVTASAAWGATSTPQSVAQALAASVNKVAGAFWTASASGDVVTLTSVSSTTATAAKSSNAKAAAAQSPSAVGVTVTDTAGFSPASFAASTTN